MTKHYRSFMSLFCCLSLPWVAVALAQPPGVLFVLDGSGSMAGKVDGRPKIEIARPVLSQMIRQLPPETLVGLMAYGHNRKDDCADIELVVPLGNERDKIIDRIESISPKGKTPLTESLRQAAAQFREYEGSSSVVLVSDGKETCEGDPCAVAREVSEAGVKLRVHVVGFDVSPEEKKQLACIAEGGGGRYFAADNADGLVAALAAVTDELKQPAPPKVAKRQTPFGVGTFEFNWPDTDCWEVRRGDKIAGARCSSGKVMLQAGTYRVNAVMHEFEPFEVIIENEKTTTVTKGGIFEFNWPGSDCWEVRNDKAGSGGCGPGKVALQAGTYRVTGGGAFEPFEITIEDGVTLTVP